MSILKPLLRRIRGLWRDERGITGLETSIMLIAFVVVASVFAFAVLSMGIFTAGETEKAVTGVFGETTSILALRGSVVAHGEELPVKEYPKGQYIKSVVLIVRPEVGSHELSKETIVNYEQDGACTLIPHIDNSSQPGLYWDVEWRQGSGPDFEGSDEAKITLQLYGLRDKLKPGRRILHSDQAQGRSHPSHAFHAQVILHMRTLLKSSFPVYVDLSTQELLDEGTITFGMYVFDATGEGITSESTEERDSPEDPYVGRLTFLVHNSAPSGSIDLSGESTVVSYSDSTQTFSDLPFLEDIANSQIGVGWGILGDSGPEIGSGERAEIQVNLFGLEDLLGPGDKFSVEVRPLVGSPLIIEDKQVPSELNPGTNRLD